jgi:transglutaminase-like putative cysteine protease
MVKLPLRKDAEIDTFVSRSPLRVHVGCSIVYESRYPTPMLLVIYPGNNHLLTDQQRNTLPAVPIHEYIDGFGNQIWRITAPIGMLNIHYDAIADVSPLPDLVRLDLPKTPIENLPDDVLVYTLPSRYCPSDLFTNEAWQLFGQIEGGSAQVQAICDWLHSNITYESGSTSSTTAWDAYHQQRGVCRDFAHLGISFCRSLNFAARYVCGYLPDINVVADPKPMDFHAWFEVYMDGLWFTFDARHNRPRTGRVLIARGRDAADVAFSTIYGSTQLIHLSVRAEQVDEKFRLGATPSESTELD